MSTKLGIFLATLALLLLLFFCPWFHWREIAGMNTKVNANVAVVNANVAVATPSPKTASEEQKMVQVKLDEQLSGKIIEFATASDQLTDKGKAVLDGLVPILKGTTDSLEIGGHTDNAGKPAANLSLSQRRAETVKKYLVGKGLDANRFTTKGYGQEKPIADNATEEGKQRNRRIEFQVTGGK